MLADIWLFAEIFSRMEGDKTRTSEKIVANWQLSAGIDLQVTAIIIPEQPLTFNVHRIYNQIESTTKVPGHTCA